MRYIYLALIAVLVTVTLVFSIQNMANVTISFLNTSARLPLAVLVVLVYAAGMVTGGSALAVLRRWIHGAGRKAA